MRSWYSRMSCSNCPRVYSSHRSMPGSFSRMTAAALAREGDLGLLYHAVEGEGQVVEDQSIRAPSTAPARPPPWMACCRRWRSAGDAQLGQRHPVRDRVDQAADLGLAFDQPQAEMRQHAPADDGAVEVAARDVDASGGVNTAACAGSPRRMMVISSVPPPKSKISASCASAQACSRKTAPPPPVRARTPPAGNPPRGRPGAGQSSARWSRAGSSENLTGRPSMTPPISRAAAAFGALLQLAQVNGRSVRQSG